MKRKTLDECLRIALDNTNESHPQWDNFMHFSFYVQKNKIIGWGINQNGNPNELFYGYPEHSKVHAEVIGYKKSRYHLDNKKPFEVVNIRTTKRGKIRLSRPCKCCYNFLKVLNCKEIWFTTEVGFASIKL